MWSDLANIDPWLVTEQEALSHDGDEVRAMHERRAKAILRKVEILQEVFEEATGLQLNCDFHDVDTQGSVYDEIDGAFYTVQGFYTPSEEALDLEKKTGELEKVGFVELAL